MWFFFSLFVYLMLLLLFYAPILVHFNFLNLFVDVILVYFSIAKAEWKYKKTTFGIGPPVQATQGVPFHYVNNLFTFSGGYLERRNLVKNKVIGSDVEILVFFALFLLNYSTFTYSSVYIYILCALVHLSITENENKNKISTPSRH